MWNVFIDEVDDVVLFVRLGSWIYFFLLEDEFEGIVDGCVLGEV